jgi:hypothetical protein
LVEEWLRFEHTIDELYDVAVLPGVRQAEAIGLIGPEIEWVVSVGKLAGAVRALPRAQARPPHRVRRTFGSKTRYAFPARAIRIRPLRRRAEVVEIA